MLNNLNKTVEFLKKKGIESPEIGIVLGTGLGKTLINQITIILSIEYQNIPNFPVSTVISHRGRLIYGVLEEKKVLIMDGRFHYYEGYSMQEVTFPIRVMRFLGIKYLLLSNASGSLNPKWGKGELMLIDDHIDLLPDNPLRGSHSDDLGDRFPDMSQPYDKNLNSQLKKIAASINIILREGVYVAVMGPNLETRAEYRHLRMIGADAVGMSTVPEVIVANQMSLPCCAISVLTDDCDPDNLKVANIPEIILIAQKAETLLTDVYKRLVFLL